MLTFCVCSGRVVCTDKCRTSVGCMSTALRHKFAWRPKWFIWDSHDGFRLGNMIGVKRVAMRFVCVCEVRRWETNVRVQNAQCWLPGVIAGSGEHGFERFEVFTNFTTMNDVPSITCKSFGNIVGTGQRRAAVNGDSIVVENTDQAIKSKMTCERGGLMTDSFHEATITSKHKCVMVHEVCAKPFAKVAFSNGHAYGISKTLAQRSRCHFNTIRVSNLWVTRSL